MAGVEQQAEIVPSGWTMKQVQEHLHSILIADLPLTRDQRMALRGVIQMCDTWQKLAPGLHKAVKQITR